MPRVPFTIDTGFLAEVRQAVLQYARNHYGTSGLSPEDLTQETIMTTFDNIREGRLTRLTSNLKTYAIGILKRKAKESLRGQAKLATVSTPSGQTSDDVLDPVDIGVAQEAIDRWQSKDDDEELDELQQAVYDIVDNMKEPCKTILWSFYWENNSMREIADTLHYNNARVATTQKSRCITKVRTAMEEIYKQMRS